MTNSEKVIKGMLEYNIRLHQIEAGFLSATFKRLIGDIGNLSFSELAFTAPSKDIIGQLVNQVEQVILNVKDDVVRAVEALTVPMWATQKQILFNVPTAGIEFTGDTYFVNTGYSFESIEEALNVDVLSAVLDDTYLPILLGVFARWVSYFKIDADNALRAAQADNQLTDSFGNFDKDKIIKAVVDRFKTLKRKLGTLIEYAIFSLSNRVTKVLTDLVKRSRSVRNSVVPVVSAILDSETCEFCLGRHGKILNSGDDWPPFHNNCRCFVTLVDTDEINVGDTFSDITITNPETGRPSGGNYQAFLREYGLRARDLPQTKIIYNGD
jgi:hypothetical protein